MRIATLFTALALSTVAVSHAEQPATRVLATPAYSVQVDACPIGFDASVHARPALHSAHAGSSSPDNLTLDLTFQPTDARTIAGAGILVHGYSGKQHVTLVTMSTDAPDDRSQTFQLTGKDAARLEHSSLAVDQMKFVNWAEITELRFTDGTTWRPSASAQCRATPSGIHPVGGTVH